MSEQPFSPTSATREYDRACQAYDHQRAHYATLAAYLPITHAARRSEWAVLVQRQRERRAAWDYLMRRY